ncbi:RAB3 GTPase activating protein catalytic subunit 1 [Carabus blaptoides fortunei]
MEDSRCKKRPNVEFVLAQYQNANVTVEDELSDDTPKIVNIFKSKYDFLPFNGKDVGPEYYIEYWYGLQHFMILSAAHNVAVNNEKSRIPTIASVIKRAAGHKLKVSKANAPIADDALVTILYYLFPDAEEHSKMPYCQPGNKENTSESSFINEQEVSSDIENMSRGIKSCGPDSLVWRLSIVLAQAMISLGGAKCVAYLWYEFVQEMRYRWEKNITIPG